MRVDVKVAWELLRHANRRTTLDIYTCAVSKQKRDANRKPMEIDVVVEGNENTSAPSEALEVVGRYR